jgi:hypothetical protein
MNHIRASLWCPLAFLPALSAGHHDAPSQFDIETFIELEGKVTDVQWAYPHVVITIDVVGEQGIESWSLQTQDPAVLRRLGISENPLQTGDDIRTYGWAPRRPDQRESFVFNLLVPSGEELVLESGGERKLSQ